MNFIAVNIRNLHAYVWGEQPADPRKTIKLNTNENPYPPHSSLGTLLKKFRIEDLKYYPDPECTRLREAAAKVLKVPADRIIFGNGSDEIIANCFKVFFSRNDSVLFTEYTYSYYRTFADIHGIKYNILPMGSDFRIDLDLLAKFQPRVFFLTNPNTPTGIALEASYIAKYLERHRNTLFIVDEAYADFARDNCARLVKKFDNLLVLRTASKAYSLCGARLGWGMSSPVIIEALNKVRDPYNVNSLTQAIGLNIFSRQPYYRKNIEKIIKTRDRYTGLLEKDGFTVYPSQSNFILCNREGLKAEDLYKHLKKKKIYIRFFDSPGLTDYVRISIGTEKEMQHVLKEIRRYI